MTAIYAHAVPHSSATFEIEAPDTAEMARRRDAVFGQSLPWLAAEAEGRVLGYADAKPFRPRPAYRFSLEHSIDVHADARGRGVGRLLLADLLVRCQQLDCWQLLAVIDDSTDAASVGVHGALGFRDVGLMRSAGRKFERWVDVVLMQRALGAGDQTAPGP